MAYLRQSANESLGHSSREVSASSRATPMSLSKTLPPTSNKRNSKPTSSASSSNSSNRNKIAFSSDIDEETDLVYRLRIELEEALKIIEQQSIRIQKLEEALKKSNRSSNNSINNHAPIENNLEHTASVSRPKDVAIVRCTTCGRTDGLEEDQDNPGMIYCSSCWNKYETTSPIIPEPVTCQPSHDDDDDDDNDTPCSIWIFHDNPRLSDLVSLESPTSVATSSGMPTLIETKIATTEFKKCTMICYRLNKTDYPSCRFSCSNLVLFVYGNAAYSGLLNGYADDDADHGNNGSTRGSYITVLKDIRALVVDLQSLPTNSDHEGIVSISLDFDRSNAASPSSSAAVAINCNDKRLLESVLKSCTDRVDVIFRPQKTDNWFPYYEGTRKLAPQFRSRHLGYLRLGDDMSKYGVAFLSLDGGRSFICNI